MDQLRALLDKVEGVLSGEPARAIGYGAAVVIYLVAKASGKIADQSFDQAIISAGAGIGVVVGVIETIRRYVYSPATVDAMTTPVDVAGVSTETL